MKTGCIPHLRTTVLSQAAFFTRLSLTLILVTTLTLYPISFVVIMVPTIAKAQEAEQSLAICPHIAHHPCQ